PRLADAAAARGVEGHRPARARARGWPGVAVRWRRGTRAADRAAGGGRLAAAATPAGRARNPRPLPQRAPAGSLPRGTPRPARPRPRRPGPHLAGAAAGGAPRLAPGDHGDRGRPGGGDAPAWRVAGLRPARRRQGP